MIFYTAISIGFEQDRYTVHEVFGAFGEVIPIPIIKENNQLSELTIEVIATLTLGHSSTAAQLGEDFIADPPVQRQDFNANEEKIEYLFELLDDDIPELIETFQIELSLVNEGLTVINLGTSGGSVFPTATVVIINDDG